MAKSDIKVGLQPATPFDLEKISIDVPRSALFAGSSQVQLDLEEATELEEQLSTLLLDIQS